MDVYQLRFIRLHSYQVKSTTVELPPVAGEKILTKPQQQVMRWLQPRTILQLY